MFAMYSRSTNSEATSDLLRLCLGQGTSLGKEACLGRRCVEGCAGLIFEYPAYDSFIVLELQGSDPLPYRNSFPAAC